MQIKDNVNVLFLPVSLGGSRFAFDRYYSIKVGIRKVFADAKKRKLEVSALHLVPVWKKSISEIHNTSSVSLEDTDVQLKD